MFVERVIELNIPKVVVFANGVDVREANGVGGLGRKCPASP